MRARAPIVIVGAGLAGAATAYHLRKAGVRDVVVLERERAPGLQASGHSAAILRERMEDPALADWSRASAAALRALGVVRVCGGFELDNGTRAADDFVSGARGTGTHLPKDGVVDVAALLARYLENLVVHADTSVDAFERAGSGLRLRTSRGDLEARALVNATGAFAGAFGDLAIRPTKRHVFVSTPDPSIDTAAPYVWDWNASYYFRPEAGGWMLCACDETPCAPEDTTPDASAEASMRAMFQRHQPWLANVVVDRHWCGHRTFTEDRLPVVGWDPRTPGLFHVAALGGHGVTLSHEVGRHAAACLLGLERPDERFAPARVLAPAAEQATS